MHKDDIEQRIHHLLLKIAFIDLITILPWYAYKEVQIQAGLDNSEIQYVTTLCAQNKTNFQVFTHAVDHVLIYLRNPIVPGVILLALIITFLLLSVKDAFWRKISTIIIIPYIFIWIFFFSYDIRNLEPVVPLIGFAMAAGFHSLSNLKVGIKEKLTAAYSIEIKSIVVNAARKIENFTTPVKPLYLLIAFTILILLSPIKFPNEYIIERSIEDQKMNVDFRLNQALYDYHEAYGFQGKILTDYQILGYLPGLEDYYAKGNQTRIDFIDKLEQPEVAYGLTRFDNMLPEVKEYYDLLESQNKIEPIFVNGLYVFFSVCHTSCE